MREDGAPRIVSLGFESFSAFSPVTKDCQASIVPYKGFKTRDGNIMIGGGNDRLFGVMCDRLSKPEWKTDPKFKTNNVRVENRKELESLIEEVTQTKKTKEWLAIFEGSGMPYAAINDVKDTLEHEHEQARGMVTEVQHPACGPMKLVSPPVKFSENKPSIRSPPPTLGQHTDEVLADLLGMEESTIKDLKEAGVVA
jgi:succinate--hydroxymethylglutarate CoA-transferase